MKKLIKFNWILSAFALIVMLSSFEAYSVHPTDRGKYLTYIGEGDIYEAVTELDRAYKEIKAGRKPSGNVVVDDCPAGMWFNPIISSCDYPENCPEY